MGKAKWLELHRACFNCYEFCAIAQQLLHDLFQFLSCWCCFFLNVFFCDTSFFQMYRPWGYDCILYHSCSNFSFSFSFFFLVIFPTIRCYHHNFSHLKNYTVSRLYLCLTRILSCLSTFESTSPVTSLWVVTVVVAVFALFLNFIYYYSFYRKFWCEYDGYVRRRWRALAQHIFSCALETTMVVCSACVAYELADFKT